MRRLVKRTVGGSPRVIDIAALPVVTVDTENAAPVVSKDTYLNATVTITGPGAVAARPTRIRGRGNTTWEQPKKPYRLNLGTAASLVPGLPADRDWVLLANYVDPSMLRTLIAMDLGVAATPMPWTPRFRYVQLVLNGAWLGVYQLGEHVKTASNRVAITTAAAGDTTGLAVTGGYTLEIDVRGYDAGDPGFITPQGVKVVYDSPGGSVPEQAAYISGHVQAFENTLYSASWLDPTTGYARYVDMQSWASWYLINELSMNQDSWFYSSCKFYKVRDTADAMGKLYFGPLWDFDLSMGRQSGNAAQRPPTGWHTRTGAKWFNRMLDDPAFRTVVQQRWTPIKARLAATTPSLIDAAAASIYYSQGRDQRAWTNPAVTGRDDPAAIKAWLTARAAWLDANLPTP